MWIKAPIMRDVCGAVAIMVIPVFCLINILSGKGLQSSYYKFYKEQNIPIVEFSDYVN